MAEAEHDMESDELPHLAQRAGAGQCQCARSGARDDDDARIDAVDETSGNRAADGPGHEEAGGRRAREADRKAALGNERGKQDGQVVEHQPRCRQGDQEDPGDDVPAVEDSSLQRRHAGLVAWLEVGWAGAQPIGVGHLLQTARLVIDLRFWETGHSQRQPPSLT